jgi:hypothetical protein
MSVHMVIDGRDREGAQTVVQALMSTNFLQFKS